MALTNLEYFQTYADFCDIEQFKSTYKREYFLALYPQFKTLFESLDKVLVPPLDKTPGGKVLKMHSMAGAFPEAELAKYLIQNPKIPICEQPCVEWEGKDRFQIDLFASGQVDPETGRPYPGGVFRCQFHRGLVYEGLSLDGGFNSESFKRVTD